MAKENSANFPNSKSSTPLSTPPMSPKGKQKARETGARNRRKAFPQDKKASPKSARVSSFHSARHDREQGSDAEIQDSEEEVEDSDEEVQGSGEEMEEDSDKEDYNSDVEIKYPPPHTSSSQPAPTAPSFSSASDTPLNLDTHEGFMPSAANNYRFKYDSPSGRRAADLDELFKLPSRPPSRDPHAREDYESSYSHFGEPPARGLADKLVKKIEAEQRKEDKEDEDEAKANGRYVKEFWVYLPMDERKWSARQRRDHLG